MAWAQLHAKVASGTSVSTLAPTAFASPLNNPSIIVVGVLFTNTTTVLSITDTAGNVYVDCGAGPVPFAASADMIQVFYCMNTHTTASNVVTVTMNASVVHLRIYISEFTGSSATNPVDEYNSVANQTSLTTGSDSLVMPSRSTNGNGDLIVAVFGTITANATAGTSPNAFTVGLAGSGGLVMEFFIQTAAGSIGPTASDTSTDTWAAIMLALYITSNSDPQDLVMSNVPLYETARVEAYR